MGNNVVGSNEDAWLLIYNSGVYLRDGELGGESYKTDFKMNQWYHIVFVAEDGMQKVYINNENVGNLSVDYNFGSWYWDDYAYIGCEYWGKKDHFFKGIIDDVRIYNRVLSEDEIDDLYNE